MKIISWNVNGLRSVHKKGFLEWLTQEKADIVCLQEIKLQEEQVPEELRQIKGYYLHCNTAIKKGYSGIAMYVKEQPIRIVKKLGMQRFDDEGRFMRLDYPDRIIIGVYMPHGGREKENLTYKLEAYKKLLNYLRTIKGKSVVVMGDLNVAHTELDLARPKQNTKNIMFTPEECAQLDNLVSLGFVDAFRIGSKDSGNYTWWPYMANARERNLGWRIDYTFVSKALATSIKKAFILPSVKGSDHCPVGIMLKK